jgi:(hydroxyamino)benzene mutase
MDEVEAWVAASWVAFWCLLHGAFAILAAYTVAAVWGVGNETIQLMGELPRGLSHGTVFRGNSSGGVRGFQQ